MGRVRMVTRTVETTIAHALVCDIENNALVAKDLTIGGHFDDPNDKALQKAIKAAYPDDIVAIIKGFDYAETLYGIEESEFLKIARVLPPRNGAKDDADAELETEE